MWGRREGPGARSTRKQGLLWFDAEESQSDASAWPLGWPSLFFGGVVPDIRIAADVFAVFSGLYDSRIR